MPKWLDHLEEQAKRAAKAVTPDVVEHAASAVVHNPVTQAVGGPVVTGAVSSMFGPAAPIISNVGQGLGILPTVPGSSAVTNPIASYMTQYGPPQAAQQAWQQGSLRPLTQLPGGLAQLATGAGGYLAGVPQRSVDYFGGEFKDNIARNTVNFAQHPGLRSGAGLLEAWFDPSFQIANNPVRDVHAYSGGTAYYVATHGGQLPSGGAAMPFNHAADWAREHPEEWGNIAKAYEQGYNGYKGDRAVWEYYIGKQDRSVRILADVTNDPWNATLLAGFLEKSLGKAAAATASYSPAGAKAIEAFAKSFALGDRVTQELMSLPLKPIELPIKGGAALLARTDAGQAIGRGAGRAIDFLHLGETEGSRAQRAANEAGNVVGNLGDQTVTQQQLPGWATPLDGTGKYEAVLADRDSGASYIVDPAGNPVPGTALEGKRSNRTNRKTAEAMNQPDYEMDPRTRQTAEKWNTEGGGRTGVTTNPTNGFAPVTGENTITNNGTSPFPEAPAAAALPTPATNTLPANAPANGPAATVGQPTEGITPAHFQQTQGQRRASVNEGMSVAAPNIGDNRLTSEVERLRAEKPDQAEAFYYGIGLDPRTGSAVPGTPAGNLMDTLNAISGKYYDNADGGLLHKVADEKLAALRFTVTEEAPLFATTMERSMRPRLSSIGQTGVDELIADLAGRKPDRGIAGLLETIVLSPSETDAAKAARALLDTRQPWLDDAVRDAQSLRIQAKRYPVGGEAAQAVDNALPAPEPTPIIRPVPETIAAPPIEASPTIATQPVDPLTPQKTSATSKARDSNVRVVLKDGELEFSHTAVSGSIVDGKKKRTTIDWWNGARPRVRIEDIPRHPGDAQEFFLRMIDDAAGPIPEDDVDLVAGFARRTRVADQMRSAVEEIYPGYFTTDPYAAWRARRAARAAQHPPATVAPTEEVLAPQAQQAVETALPAPTPAVPSANPLTPAIPADDPRRVPMDFWQDVKPPIGRRPGETLAEWTARVNARGNEANVRGTTLFDDVLDSEAIAANRYQPVAPTYDRLGISPLDAEGSTPFPEIAPPATADDVMGITPVKDADEGVPAATVQAAGGPPEDPAVVTLLDELHQRGVVDDTERDYLQKVYPGMEKPLLEEILTRQRQGMSTRDIQNDIRGAIYRSGRPASQAKKTVAKATGAIADVRAGKQQAILDGTDRSLVDAIAQGASTFSTNARQSQQYNILNLVPGGLGDIAGNAMHFQQTNDIRGLGRFLSPNNLFLMLGGETKVASRFTPEADDLLAGFNRAMPEHIMPKAGEAGLTRYGHNDQTLVLWGKAEARAARKGKNVPIWQKAPLHAIQSPWSQSFRTGIDLSSRGVRFTTSLDNQLDTQLAQFADELTAAGLPAEQTIDAIRRHATAERAPKAFTTANPNGVLRSFEPEDVRAITGSEDLTRKWRSRQNSMYKQAAKDTNTTFFTDAKRFGVDDALSKVFFYHFWQSRALALQARSMLRNPRVMGQYYRMIQGAMNEADQKGYPQTFRGLLHYMGDEQGFYGLFNPLGVLIPAMMFGDLAMQQGEGNLDRLSSILPINPLITGAAAALGLTDDIPNLFGTTRVQNMVAGIINYGRAHGIDFGRQGMYRDPVSHWTQRVFELVNQKAGKAISGQRYEPYDPQSGKLDTIRSIIYHTAEQDFGPAEQWTPEQWQEVNDAMDALDVGGAGNDRADAAFAAYSDANMRNLVMGSILPQGSVLRYGPRETARNDAKISDGSLAAQQQEAAGQLQRDIVQASPETRHILIGQQQLAQLGTERQQNLYSDWNAIVYGPDSAGPADRQNYVTVQGRNVTIAQLQEMTIDQRTLIANAYIAEQGGTQELSQYRDARKAAIAANPALATYDEYKKTLDDFEGGVRGYRAWAASASPEYAAREQERRAYLQSRGGTGGVTYDASGVHVSGKSNAAIEAELDDWAFSTDAYTAFSGKQGDIYDAKPLGGADTSNDPMAALRAGAGTQGQGSGGSGSGGDSLAARLDRAIASYQQKMAEYQAAGGPSQQLPGMFGQGQEIMYGQMPQPSAELARYILWANRQPPGADTSTQAYEAWVTANTPALVGQ